MPPLAGLIIENYYKCFFYNHVTPNGVLKDNPPKAEKQMAQNFQSFMKSKAIANSYRHSRQFLIVHEIQSQWQTAMGKWPRISNRS